MGNYSFSYINAEETSDETTVKWGTIDYNDLGRAVLGHFPSKEERLEVKVALKESASDLTRCQHDLIMLEFGRSKEKLEDVYLATNIMDDPVESRVSKLTEALDIVREKTLRN